MTSVPAIAAIEAAVGRQPLATLQALAEAVTRDAAAPLAAPAGTVDTQHVQAPAETQVAQRPLEHLLQPALVTALHAPPSEPARPRQVPDTQRRDDRRDDAPDDERPQREEDPDEVAAEEAPAPLRAAGAQSDERPRHDREGPGDDASSAAAASLAALLRAQGPAEAVADLSRGRRVLLVLPAADPALPGHGAQAWLLGGRRARRFAASWRPGVAGAAWPAWRLFRDGDPLLARGLASRSGACRLRLGPAPAPRIADLGHPATATLVINDRQRFANALGGQWSVVLTVAPPGTGRP